MGVYRYAIRERSVNAIHNGYTVKVHALTYLNRVAMHYMDLCRGDGQITRVNRFWEDRGIRDHVGRLVFWGEHATDGAPVYRYELHAPVCSDSCNFGHVIGHLRKNGRRWVIVPKETVQVPSEPGRI